MYCYCFVCFFLSLFFVHVNKKIITKKKKKYVLCFLSSVDCNYFICSDFNIHVDVPCTDSYNLESLLESCNLTQPGNNTTHLHGHILDLILSPSDQDGCVHVDICEFISDHSVIKWAINFPSSLAVKQEFPIGGTIVSICPTFGLTLKKCLL